MRRKRRSRRRPRRFYFFMIFFIGGIYFVGSNIFIQSLSDSNVHGQEGMGQSLMKIDGEVAPPRR